jgi:hypothetical protein
MMESPPDYRAEFAGILADQSGDGMDRWAGVQPQGSRRWSGGRVDAPLPADFIPLVFDTLCSMSSIDSLAISTEGLTWWKINLQ